MNRGKRSKGSKAIGHPFADISHEALLTSKLVPVSLFTLKTSMRGLELIIKGNPGTTGASDTDKFTENLCTKVPGGEFSATLLVAGKWTRCSASPPADLKRMQNDMNTRLNSSLCAFGP